MIRRLGLGLLALTLGCGGPADTPPGDGAAPAPDVGAMRDLSSASGDGASGLDAAAGVGLAAKYPGDVGIDQDPDVVWTESFEEGSVGGVTGRYDDFKNAPGMALSADVPAKSSGKASLALTAGGTGPTATDFYKQLPSGYDELYLRYYAKYQGGIEWHHSSVWLGGYNPPIPYPYPQAGLKPNGDDRFAVSFEPVGAVAGGMNPPMDFYNYWMTMHSWMAVPMGTTAYYGNTLIHQNSQVVADDAWMCIEVHVKLNPNPASPAGAELGLYRDDAPIIQFTDQAPVGYWIRDKFCPMGADSTECTNYPPPMGTVLIPLDLQYRSVAQLQLNYLWPQNYITSGPAGTVKYDDLVLAKSRVGCIR